MSDNWDDDEEQDKDGADGGSDAAGAAERNSRGGVDLGKGGILVFLPGLGEIMQLFDRLMHSRIFSRQDRYKVLAVHSSLSTEDQRSIFKRTPPGCRKIVLATNIAETRCVTCLGIAAPKARVVILTLLTAQHHN